MRKRQLSRHLQCAPQDIKESECGLEHVFQFAGSEYIVLTREESIAEAMDQIQTFMEKLDVRFLNRHLKVELPTELLEKFFTEKCDVCKSIIWDLIANKERFLHEALQTYGIGHFLAWYDGKEHQYCTVDGCYYVYQVSGPE